MVRIKKIKNPTLSIDVHLLEEQSCQISSRSDLKGRSPRLFIYNFIHRKVAKQKQKKLTMKNNNRTRYKH